MLRIDNVVGSRLEPDLAERLHHLEHEGRIDILPVATADIARRRMMAQTTSGEAVAITLPRDQKLFDGAVLLMEEGRAIVVHVDAERWLRFQPRCIADAVELGYHAGNMHWRVRFAGEALLIALQAPVDDYLARLGSLAAPGRISFSVIDGDAPAC